jgi:hypothetical protein
MKRALFVAFKKYNGILDGGGMANQRNLIMAQKVLGADQVDAVYLHDDSKKRSLWNLFVSALCFPFGYFNGMIPSKVAEIAERAMSYDYVFISTTVLGVLAKELKKRGYKGVIIAHFHNVESIYYDSQLPKRMPLRSVIINCAAKNDEYCCRYADKILTLNRRDSDILSKMYGREADLLVPIALEDKCFSANFDRQSLTGKRPLCLFLGSYFTANTEGITWFVKNVLPHVDINLKIVGRGMAKLKEDDECFRDIEIINDAPDLAPYFLSADFMILPIFSGSGMKVKTCESLMYGKNILGTDEAFEGYTLDTERVGGCCNSADDFIRCLRHFATNPVPRFNAYARKIYEESYSEASSLNVFRKAFDC